MTFHLKAVSGYGILLPAASALLLNACSSSKARELAQQEAQRKVCATMVVKAQLETRLAEESASRESLVALADAEATRAAVARKDVISDPLERQIYMNLTKAIPIPGEENPQEVALRKYASAESKRLIAVTEVSRSSHVIDSLRQMHNYALMRLEEARLTDSAVRQSASPADSARATSLAEASRSRAEATASMAPWLKLDYASLFASTLARVSPACSALTEKRS
jgi:hypothetical protein